jgi:hypothetical protein
MTASLPRDIAAIDADIDAIYVELQANVLAHTGQHRLDWFLLIIDADEALVDRYYALQAERNATLGR